MYLRQLGIVHGVVLDALIDYLMTNLLNNPNEILSDYKINLKESVMILLNAKARRLVLGETSSPIYCEIINGRDEIIADAIGNSGILRE